MTASSVDDGCEALDLTSTCIRAFDGTILSWHKGNELLYGWSRDEAVGRVTHDLLQTEFPEPLPEIESKLLKRRRWAGELLHKTKAGNKIWVASQWILQLTSEGLPRCVIEMNTDITAIKLSQRSPLYLAAIVESSDDAIISKDLNGIVTSWNPGAERLFGYSAAEMIGTSILRLFPPELVPEEHSILTRIGRGERIQHYETTRVDKKGHRIPISLAISPVRDAEGRVIGASKIARDISEQKNLEETIRRTEERQRLAVEAGEVGLWSYDVNLRIAHWTLRCRAIWGLPSEDTVTSYEAILPLIHPDDTAAVEAAFRSSIVDPKPFRLEFRVMDAASGMRWIQCTGRPRTAVGSKVTEINGTLIDFTARKQIEDALLRSNNELQQFAYLAAHDLQEPLRNIALYVELAKRLPSSQLNEESKSLLDRAIGSANQMQAMVRDLLAYSKVMHESQESAEIADAAEILRLALINLKALIEEASPEITWDPLPVVKIPKAQLLQVFQNLISNSLKHRGASPLRIHIGATTQMTACKFSVQDNGVGIEPQFHQRVFDVFKRLQKRDTPGTGVGLALCKRIIELHGGRIWIESDGKTGTTFFFTLQTAYSA